MQVAAISTRSHPDWRWRIVNYAGEVIGESRDSFATIAIAVAHGQKHLEHMDLVDRSMPPAIYRSTTHLRGRRN